MAFKWVCAIRVKAFPPTLSFFTQYQTSSHNKENNTSSLGAIYTRNVRKKIWGLYKGPARLIGLIQTGTGDPLLMKVLKIV